VPVAAAGMEDRRSRAAGSGGVVPHGFPMSPVRDWIRQSRSMYVLWTGDGPVMYPPYTCAGDMPGSPGREVRLGRCERGARPTGANPARRIGRRSICNVRATGRPWTEAQVKSQLVADGNPRQLDRSARR
jgi:hypothetical protein